jgi:hypothetical protein
MMEKSDRTLLVAVPFIPDEAGAPIEVIGAIPIDRVKAQYQQ